jgi:hypothetical protein
MIDDIKLSYMLRLDSGKIRSERCSVVFPGGTEWSVRDGRWSGGQVTLSEIAQVMNLLKEYDMQVVSVSCSVSVRERDAAEKLIVSLGLSDKAVLRILGTSVPTISAGEESSPHFDIHFEIPGDGA